MSTTPPIPDAAQAPYPTTAPPQQEPSAMDQVSTQLDQGITAARDAAGPLLDQAKTFVKERPWTAAALIGSIGVAVFNSLRGRR